jgi:hypothetical protein
MAAVKPAGLLSVSCSCWQTLTLRQRSTGCVVGSGSCAVGSESSSRLASVGDDKQLVLYSVA